MWINIIGSIPGLNGLDVLVFSYFLALFNKRTVQDPVKKLSKSLDRPRLIVMLCTSLVTSDKDTVISLAILNGIDFNVNERDEYLKVSSLIRKNEKNDNMNITEEKITQFQKNEEFILKNIYLAHSIDILEKKKLV